MVTTRILFIVSIIVYVICTILINTLEASVFGSSFFIISALAFAVKHTTFKHTK